MLNVAIIGCGKIADSHLSQIRRISDCAVVAVCDCEPLMADQLAERFSIGRSFADVQRMFTESRPDVVHITTPPDSHFELAKLCLEQGCHVYVEKPFTLYLREAQELLDLADRKALKITAGHDDQFSPAARRLRETIRSGYLGGPPVHVESYYCYELADSYARALLSDQEHWVRRLPGGLLQNIVSHGIARIAEFLSTDSLEVTAVGFVSPELRRRGEQDLIDELRVIMKEATGLTAYFTFSTQMRPSLHQLRVYGPKNGLVLDADQQTVVKLNGSRYKSYLEKFVAPLELARQQVANVKSNAALFLRSDFHMKEGMKFLIESFYHSIVSGASPPISMREILLTSCIMDKIFAQIKPNEGNTSERC